jgi:serine/threonine-protein kinase HipA
MKDPKSINELVIYRGTRRAGILKRTENGCTFEYDQAFINDSLYTGIAYRMPKSPAPWTIHGTNLHPFFAGLLPEGLRFKALLSSVKTSQDDLFSLFAAAGAGCIGDVYAKTESEAPPVTPKLKEIDFYDYLKILLKGNAYARGEDAISGVQEKISTSMISFPLNIAKENHSYILKLNPNDKPHLVENEFYCMALAKKCGIDTAQVKFVRDKNNNLGLLVNRFDRVFDAETKKMTMIHQEDACQFLDKYPSEKYRLSMNDIAGALAELASIPPVALLQLLRTYCFSYIIGNGDLHAKNISLRTLQDRVSLTPAYDLISTYIYGDRSMALKIDGKDDNVKRKMVVEFAKRFEIKEKAIKHMLDKLVADLSDHHSLLFKIPMEDRAKSSLKKVFQKRLKDLS